MSRKRRTLQPEEKELWNRVAQTATPMHPNTPAPKSEPAPILLPEVKQPSLRIAPFSLGQKPSKGTHSADIAPSIGDQLYKLPVQMDGKTHGKMKRGKLSPEARIDLHGMTIAQAHPALLRFIMGSYASGKRLVLVITGKGKTKEDYGPIPTRRGVLKHQVPQWLHSEPMRQVVLQVTESHVKHGGTGAYYIYLRRHR
ncbi:Smr/MutS family protein [Cochlodiniinecator piscidefendens]|uniref:Smr/MutS family protein n=1 Tax=Cochlodiniinecator piscidefendens TaxID=2715756 RepID=UPI00140B2967|nr:Smr/MutS family protein [Cochlodiniinecator piscidefendens]